MMQDWNAYRSALHERIGDFASLVPDVMAGVARMTEFVAKPGHLDPKMHTLIALAVAVTTRCDGCIAAHTQKAAEYGATRDETAETLGAAIALMPVRHSSIRRGYSIPMRNCPTRKSRRQRRVGP